MTDSHFILKQWTEGLGHDSQEPSHTYVLSLWYSGMISWWINVSAFFGPRTDSAQISKL